jgi:hypothetical protein
MKEKEREENIDRGYRGKKMEMVIERERERE